MSKKKDFFKKNKTAVIIAAVVIIAIIAFSFISKPETTSISETEDSKIVSKISDLVPSEIDCIYLGESPKFGPFAQYTGRITNQGSNTITDAKITVEFFDANGNSVGTHETSIVGDKIEPGTERPFFSYTEKGTLSGEFTTCTASVE